MYSAGCSCQISMELELSRLIFENSLNVTFHEDPFSRSRVVPCGRTDMTKLIVAFRNFEEAIKEGFIIRKYITHEIKVINYLKAEGVLL